MSNDLTADITSENLFRRNYSGGPGVFEIFGLCYILNQDNDFFLEGRCREDYAGIFFDSFIGEDGPGLLDICVFQGLFTVCFSRMIG